MKSSDIEKKHDQAVGFYVEGRYGEAGRIWAEILEATPEDVRAAEGVRMAELLASEQTSLRGACAAAGSRRLAAPEVELERIEALLRDGAFHEALDAARELQRDDPDPPHGQGAGRRAIERIEAHLFIASELALARSAFEAGSRKEAEEAARRVIAIDANQAEALGILDMVARRDPAADSAGQAVTPTAGVSGTGPCDGDWLEEISDQVSQGTAFGASIEGAFQPDHGVSPSSWTPEDPAREFGFGLVDDSEARGTVPPGAAHGMPGASPVDPAASSPFDLAAEPPGSGGDPGPSGLDPEAESLLDGGPSEDLGLAFADVDESPFDPLAGWVESEPAASAQAAPISLPSSHPDPLASRPSAEGRPFMDLEAEFEETACPQRVAGKALPGERRAEPPALDPGESLAADLTFPGQVGQSPAFQPAAQSPADRIGAATPAGGSPGARIQAFVAEARELLHAGRLPEAIETAARAFAIDPDAAGAQEVIEEARRLQDERDRQAEEHIETARRLLTEGDLDGAEMIYKEVLSTHPGHREVIEALELVARRRGGSSIPFPAGTEEAAAAPRPQQAQDLPWSSGEAAPLLPRAPRSVETEAPAHPEEVPATAAWPAAAPAVRGGLRRRLAIYGLVGAGLILLTVLGRKHIDALVAERVAALENHAPAELPAGTPKEIIHIDKPPRGASELAAAAPAAAAGKPGMLEDAMRLEREGHLDEAQAILKSLVSGPSASAQERMLLQSVSERIQRRDERARVMAAIRSAHRDERYEDALRMLYRLPEEMQKGEIETYKANAWYNTAILYMLAGNCTEAIRCLDESLAIHPRDDAAKRLKAFAQSYLSREKDGAYLAHVENLPRRALEHH